jgi:hypothetical protein
VSGSTGLLWPALLLGAAALLLWDSSGNAVARRARALRRTVEPRPRGRSADRRAPRWLLAGVAGVSVAMLVGGVLGTGLAVGVAVGVERLLRSRQADDRQARTALVRDLPVACELRGVAALYRMGADPRRAWADVPPELAGLGRVLVRAGESGSTVAPALRALAADGRAAARAATEAAVRRAGVWVLAPLGLCFLPAFVCLGVVPLILGIAGDVFG